MSGNDKGNGISGRLTSLWNTSTEKDDTCVTWGLVSRPMVWYAVWSFVAFSTSPLLPLSEQEGEDHWLLHLSVVGSSLLWSGEISVVYLYQGYE